MSTEKTDFVCEAVVIGSYSASALRCVVKGRALRELAISPVMPFATTGWSAIVKFRSSRVNALACERKAMG